MEFGVGRWEMLGCTFLLGHNIPKVLEMQGWSSRLENGLERRPKTYSIAECLVCTLDR